SESIMLMWEFLQEVARRRAWAAGRRYPRADPTLAPATPKETAPPLPEGAVRCQCHLGGGMGRSGGWGVAQFAAQDLADVGLGQLLAELDNARMLVAGQVCTGVLL